MSVTIKFPTPADGTSVSIAGTFNHWQPEDMNLSKDGSTYDKVLTTTQDGPESHQFKFVTSTGHWILEEGRPTMADENGVLNHKIDLRRSTLETILDDSSVANSRVNERDHIAPPESVSVSEDMGVEVVDRNTPKNEYSAYRSNSAKGPGIVDSSDASIRVGDRISNTVIHGSHDSHLNPAAPAFSPTAPPFVPAANPPAARHKHSNSRSSHRQRSQSRSRTSHSRSSSIVSSSQRARSSSSLHHDELNPTAHEFRPQFAQPTNHIAHASGYAAALKKPASPPVKEEFKKQIPPTKSTSAHPADTPIAQAQHANDKHAAIPSPASSEQHSSISYASIAKHGASENSLDASHAANDMKISETRQRSALDSHKDPILNKEVISAGQEAYNISSGNGSTDHADVSQNDSSDLESAIKEVEAGKVPDAEHVTEAAKSEVHQIRDNVLDPAVEALKEHVGELKSVAAKSLNDAEPKIAENHPPSQDDHVEAQPKSKASENVDSQTNGRESSTENVEGKNPQRVASVEESVNSSANSLQQANSHALPSSSEGIKSMVDTVSNTLSEVSNSVQESFKEAAGSATSTARSEKRSTVQRETNTKSEPLDTIELSSVDYDEEQIRLMDEICILLDRDDKPIGSATKKDAHLMSNIQDGLLHRAFSLFIFNSDNELLLQQRASEKITFPDMWTNTCCSHPLDIAGEVSDTLEGSIAGVKRAAQRKVEQELGIRAEEAPTANMDFLTRIHYLAPSDGKWGEHEIDYILFLRSTPSLNINANEVRDYKWVSQTDLRKMFGSSNLSYTPWFKLICETFLYKWWDNLENLESCKDESTIHRLGIEPDLFERIVHTPSDASKQSEAAPTETVSEVAQQVGSTVRQESSKIAEVASRAQDVIGDNLSEIKQRVLGQAESSSTPTKDSSTVIDDSEPAAEDSLPLESTPDPTFKPSKVQPRTEDNNGNISNGVSADAEPAAEDSTISVPESKDPVESEIQESFGATQREADSTQHTNKPDAVLELSPAGQAKIDAHESTAPETVSRPGTGKRSIRAKQNFFFYIFNSLFGGIFKGFSNIFHKLAFWRKSPDSHQQD